MLFLPHNLYVSCTHKLWNSDSIEKRSTTSSSRSRSPCESLRSISSSSSRKRSETQDRNLCPSSPHRPSSYRTQQYGGGESGSDMQVNVHRGAQRIDPIDNCEEWTESMSSLMLDLPHNCTCKPRSTCTNFLQEHFARVRTHHGRRPPVILLAAYLASADAYAQSCDELSRTMTKLKRAQAEYDWMLNGQNRTLWSPRLHGQLSAAQSKIAAAQEERELLDKKRCEMARCLVNFGRF